MDWLTPREEELINAKARFSQENRIKSPTFNPEQSCTGCRYDSQRFLCLHPDESKPGFWEDGRVVEGRPWCWEKERNKMSQTCTRCEGTGFLNAHQIPDDVMDEIYNNGVEVGLTWIAKNDGHDVSVCDCCGDGENWYGVPGEHYNSEDPPGKGGPYDYNGGLCECH